MPYDKSFIDQASSVKMAEYWPRSFFCVFMDLDLVSFHKNAKKSELGQHPAILTSRLVSNIYITYGVNFLVFVLKGATFKCWSSASLLL